MKRTKQRTFGSERGGSESDNYFAKGPAPKEPIWEDVVAQEESAFVAYSMATTFAKGAFLVHSKFGKGVVVGVEPVRIEVLFESGLKKLGHAS